MTAITIQGPILALDPATRSTLVQAVVDSLPIIPTAPESERAAQMQAAFALLEKLAPTDPVEAMLAFQIVAAQNAGANAARCAARPDLPPALHLRYQAMAATLSRLTSSKRRELLRHQAAQPVLPPGFTAARAAQAQATTPNAQVNPPAQPAASAPQPKAAPAQRRATPTPATPAPAAAPSGRAASAAHAEIDQLLAMAAAASHPARHDDTPPTAEKVEQLPASAQAALAEIPPAPEDMGARLQAEIATRKAAATKLAA